jgi:hypothetical protein
MKSAARYLEFAILLALSVAGIVSAVAALFG